MKLKSDFMLREIAGTWLVVPLGNRVVDFNGLITLSETGAFLWKLLQDGKEDKEALVAALLEEYDVDRETAEADVTDFLDQLEKESIAE